MVDIALLFVLALTWPFLLYRLYVVVKRNLTESHSQSSTITWQLWPPTTIMALAGTAYHPLIRGFLDSAIAEGMGLTICNNLAIVAFILAARTALRFTPFIRRNWTLPAGIFSMLSFTLLNIFLRPAGRVFPMLANITFATYLIMVSCGIILPALRWIHMKEEILPARLRIWTLMLIYYFTILWMSNDIVSSLLSLFDREEIYVVYDAILAISITGIGTLFAFSFFASRRLYVRLSHLHHLVVFVKVRLLELYVCRWLVAHVEQVGRKMTDHSLSGILRDPESAIYRSTIAILDVRKLLKVHADRPRRRISNRLELVARPSASYREVVQRLSAISQAFFPRLLLAEIRWRLRPAG